MHDVFECALGEAFIDVFQDVDTNGQIAGGWDTWWSLFGTKVSMNDPDARLALVRIGWTAINSRNLSTAIRESPCVEGSATAPVDHSVG